MNSALVPPVIGRSTRRRWPWVVLLVLLLLPVGGIGLVGLGVVSLFRVSSDTRALRNTLMQSSGARWEPQISLHAGALTLGAARAGLSFLDLEPEARAALRSARGAEVSICRALTEAEPDRRLMLEAADRRMESRGWERVIGVHQGCNLVAVYVPRDCDSFRRVECTVAVFTGEELVVAAARANLEPLLQCVLERPEFQAGLREGKVLRGVLPRFADNE